MALGDATVRGSFELSANQAIRELHGIRDAGAEADAALDALGRRMDTLSRKRATPRVDLTGFDRVNAQLTELELRLDRLDRRRVSPHVGIGGGFSNLAGGGGGGGTTATSAAASRGPSSLFQAAGGVPTIALAALGLSPGILGLAGGATALAGSAGSAAMGAGTVALGGLGPLVAGLGLTAVAAKPAFTELGNITKAQQQLNTAIAAYGRNSAQAATQRRQLNAAEAAAPGAAGASRQLSLFQSAQQRAFAPARGQVYRGVSGVLFNARGALPAVGSFANQASSATANAAISYSRFLTGPQTLGQVGTLTSAFAAELPTAERTLQNMTATLGNLATAAIPFFHEANVWVQNWTAGLAQSSSDTARVQGKMQGYVTSAEDWARLTGAAFRTIRDIFNAGAPTGDSMVVSLTNTLDRWDRFINDNPQRAQSFFRQAETTTSNIASALVSIVRDIAQLANFLTPIFNRATQFLGFVSGIGPGGLGLAGALGLGAYQGLRGATGGALPSAGSLAGAFITGGAGPSFRGGGVGGVAGLGGVGRASNLEVLRGQTAAGAFLMGGATVGPEAVLARRASALAGEESALSRLIGRSAIVARGADLLGGLRGLGGAAVEGAARFALPVLGITSLLQAAQTPGGPGAKLMGGLNSAVNMSTLGMAPHSGLALPGGALGLLGGRSLGLGLLGSLATAGVGAFVGTTAQALMHPSVAGAQFTPDVMTSLRGLASQAGGVRTQAQANAIQTQATALGRLRFEMSPGDARALQAQLTNIANVAARNAGTGASSTWEQAFLTGLQREGPTRAVAQMERGIQAQLARLKPVGRVAFAQATASWVRQLEIDNPKLRRPLDQMMNQMVADMNRMSGAVKGNWRDMTREVFYFNGQILQGSTKAWGNIRDSLVNPASVAQEKLLGIFGTIQQEAVHALEMMGYSRNAATSAVTNLVRGGARSQIQQTLTSGVASGNPTAGIPRMTSTPHGHQRGGLLDTITLPDGSRAAPGEAYIANRHTMNKLSSATLAKFGKTAWQMIRDETRPHSAPFALGGAITGAINRVAGAVGSAAGGGYGGYSLPLPRGSMMPGHWSIDQGVDIPAGANTPEFAVGPGVITGAGISGFGPNAPILRVSAGPLAGRSIYYGHAGTNTVPVGAHVRAGQQITEVGAGIVGLSTGPHLEIGFYPPGSMGSGSAMEAVLNQLLSGAGVSGVGGVSGGARGMMPAPIHLRAPRSTQAGVPGMLVDAGSRTYANALSQTINRLTGAAGISAAGFTGGGNSQANQALGRRMMLAAGWGPDQWPALQALWTQESGWNQNARNPSSGAQGIPQALGHGNIGSTPAQQIAWGLNYIRGRYGSPDAAEAHERAFNWYQRGGKINWAGWNNRGASFITNGATLFGAGEGRREQVNITPVGSGGGHSISVHIANANMRSDQEIEHVARVVAGKILDAIDQNAHGGSDRQLAGATG